MFCKKKEKGPKIPDSSASQNNGWARRSFGSLPVSVKIAYSCCPIIVALPFHSSCHVRAFMCW
jgi:hypothetical protein